MKRSLASNHFQWVLFFLTLGVYLSIAVFGIAADIVYDPPYGYDKDYGTPKYGGTIVGVMGEPRSLDPHMETYGNTNVVCNNTMNSLLRISPDMKSVELDLAESIEQPNDLTYVVKIHKGVKFHNIPPVNGRECTSADVKYSFERISGKYGRASYFKHRYYFENIITSIETPDKYTVVFKTKEPFAPFIRYLASPWCMIVPKEAVDAWGDLKRKSVGTGPFMLKEYVRGSHIIMVKNPNYFKKGKPYVDEVVVKLSSDANANFAAFLAKDYERGGVAYYNRETVAKEASEAVLADRSTTHMLILRTPPWIEGKLPQRPPFNDKRVRQAIAMAIDKEKLIELANGGYGDAGIGPVPTTVVGSLTPADQVEYNPEKSKKLLAEAGYPDGFQTTLMTWNSPTMTRPVQVVQDMLNKVGIKTELQIMEMAQYFNKAYRFQYDMALHVTTAGCDMEEWLVPYFGDVATSTYYKWSNTELWDMIKKQSHIMDPQKRLAYVRDIQRKILDDSPVVFLYTWRTQTARWPWLHYKHYLNEYNTSIHEETYIDQDLRKKMAGR